MTKLTKKSFLKLFHSSNNILITTHIKPDADAIGSSLALLLFLKKLQKNAVLILPSEFPQYYSWFPGIDDVLIFDKSPQQLKTIETSELFFAVDFNEISRIDELGVEIEKQSFTKVLIDHHPDKPDIYDYEYWNTGSSAAAEEVANLIRDIDPDLIQDKDITTCLYAALISDTGSFKFPSVSFKTHELVAEILRSGIDHTAIHRRIYDNFHPGRLKLWGYAINEKTSIYPDIKTAIISLSRSDFKKYNCDLPDSEGLVNFPHVISDIEIAVLIYEKENGSKISFRSKTIFPVNEIARKYFNGGGHFHAAGGESNLNLKDTEIRIVEVISNRIKYPD